MYHFCTIGSGNYLPFIQTLFYSLQSQNSNVVLHALLTEGPLPENSNKNLRFYSVDQLQEEEHVNDIISRYSYRNDYMRWALKPVFMLYLNKSIDELIYVDNDIYFFKPFEFLFEELAKHSLLLTPHWCSFDPLPHDE